MNNGETKRIIESAECFFKPRNIKIDWRKIASIDFDHFSPATDYDKIQQNILSITYCDIENEFGSQINYNFVKLFKIAQYTIEYLLFTQDQLLRKIKLIQQNYKAMYKDAVIDQKVLFLTKKKLIDLKKESNRQRQIIKSYKEMFVLCGITKKELSHIIHKCPYCAKAFISDDFLTSHLERRHFNADISAGRDKIKDGSILDHTPIIIKRKPSESEDQKRPSHILPDKIQDKLLPKTLDSHILDKFYRLQEAKYIEEMKCFKENLNEQMKHVADDVIELVQNKLVLPMPAAPHMAPRRPTLHADEFDHEKNFPLSRRQSQMTTKRSSIRERGISLAGNEIRRKSSTMPIPIRKSKYGENQISDQDGLGNEIELDAKKPDTTYIIPSPLKAEPSPNKTIDDLNQSRDAKMYRFEEQLKRMEDHYNERLLSQEAMWKNKLASLEEQVRQKSIHTNQKNLPRLLKKNFQQTSANTSEEEGVEETHNEPNQRPVHRKTRSKRRQQKRPQNLSPRKSEKHFDSSTTSSTHSSNEYDLHNKHKRKSSSKKKTTKNHTSNKLSTKFPSYLATPPRTYDIAQKPAATINPFNRPALSNNFTPPHQLANYSQSLDQLMPMMPTVPPSFLPYATPANRFAFMGQPQPRGLFGTRTMFPPSIQKEPPSLGAGLMDKFKNRFMVPPNAQPSPQTAETPPKSEARDSKFSRFKSRIVKLLEEPLFPRDEARTDEEKDGEKPQIEVEQVRRRSRKKSKHRARRGRESKSTHSSSGSEYSKRSHKSLAENSPSRSRSEKPKSKHEKLGGESTYTVSSSNESSSSSETEKILSKPISLKDKRGEGTANKMVTFKSSGKRYTAEIHKPPERPPRETLSSPKKDAAASSASTSSTSASNTSTSHSENKNEKEERASASFNSTASSLDDKKPNRGQEKRSPISKRNQNTTQNTENRLEGAKKGSASRRSASVSSATSSSSISFITKPSHVSTPLRKTVTQSYSERIASPKGFKNEIKVIQTDTQPIKPQQMPKIIQKMPFTLNPADQTYSSSTSRSSSHHSESPVDSGLDTSAKPKKDQINNTPNTSKRTPIKAN